MGCCSSNRPKPDASSFKTNNLPEILLSFDEVPESTYKNLTFVISEIKLTKVFEKITSFPCTLKIIIKTHDKIFVNEVGDV